MSNLITAPFGRRLAALFVDWIVAGVLVAPFFVVPANATDAQYLELAFSRNWITTDVFVVTQTIFIWAFGSSLGQRLLKLRVVRADGGRVGLFRAFLRSVLLVLVIPALVTDSNSRGMHDKAANSAIIKL